MPVDTQALATSLMTAVPTLDEKFKQRNQRTLELWRDNNPDYKELSALIEAWSRLHQGKLDDTLQESLLQAVIWLVGVAANEQPKASYAAVQAASYWSNRLPWDAPIFLDSFRAIVGALDRTVRGSGRPLVAQALSRLVESASVPEVIRTSATQAQLELQAGISNGDLPRTPAAPAPLPPGLPDPQRSQAAVPIAAICDALANLLERHLDPRKREENLRTIATARRDIGQNPSLAVLSDLRLLSWLVFSNLDYRTRSDVFRVPADEATDLDLLATFMQSQTPPPTLRAAQVAAPFIFWFRALRALEGKHASPREIYTRVIAHRRTGSLDSDDKAYIRLIAFGNTYLRRLLDSGELDANSLAEWLEVYRDVLQANLSINTGALLQHLTVVSDLAKPFIADQRVAFLLTAIDPHALQHPWTRPEVFPFLSSDECQRLENDMKSLRLKNIRTFLTAADVREKFRQHLVATLADPTYDEFQAPIRSIEGFGRPDKPTVERVREVIQQTRSDDQGKRRLLREWFAYARTSSHDIMGAKELWEQSPSEDRSYEERWNLAVVYVRIGQIRRALDTLWEPGLRNSDAPYEHLRFAVSLALQLDWDRESTTFPQADLYRRLPTAAAQAFVYALSPPSDADADMQQLNLIKELATAPVASSLDAYRNARTMRYNDLIQSFTPIKNRLVDLRLKATWRTWLTGYVNQFPTASALWEALHDAWAIDDRTHGKAILERGLRALRHARTQSEQLGLIGLLRRYVMLLDDEELQRQRPQLQRYAKPVQQLLQEKALAVYRKVWPDDRRDEEKDKKDIDIWGTLDSLLRRGADDIRLARAVADCTNDLVRIAPDAHADIVRWREALDQFIVLKKHVRSHTATDAQIASFNDWLVQNPPRSCSGLLQRFRKLADYLHGSFVELVQVSGVGPSLVMESCDDDPGIANPPGAVMSACVRITNPTSQELDQLFVSANSSAAIQPLKQQTPALRLAGGSELTVALPISIAPSHASDDPLHLSVSATYSWGVVQPLETKTAFDVPRFSFVDYLAHRGVTQDHLPKVFEYDTDLKGELLGRLFVGREQEIEYVRRSFAGLGSPPGTPIYYHGIRRVGKTSLLRRLSEHDVLPADKYVPLYVSLFGLQAADPLVAGCRLIRERALQALGGGVELGLSCPSIEPGEDYQVLEAFQNVVAWLRAATAPRIPMILIDEFHNLVTPQAAPLLDLLRRLYQEAEVRFIFAGWKDHEVLREESKRSQLWPLTQRPINFLSAADADELVRSQLTRIGVHIPTGTLDYAMALTAGHPNLLQKLFQLVVEELDANRRPVVTISDIEVAATDLVADRAQFTTSWFNRDIITPGEETATKEIIDKLEEPGGWVTLDNRLSEATRRDYILPLIAKQVLSYEPEMKRVKIRGLLLERFLQSVRDISRYEPGDGRDNVALFVDYENIAKVFPDGTSPASIAGVMDEYARHLGNPIVRIVAANWRSDDARVKNAFAAQGFSVIDPLRTQGRGGAIRSRSADKDVADAALTRAIYDRMLDEREGMNDRIAVYAIASGDGRYLEYIKDLVHTKGRRCRLLARREHSHMSRDYLLFEAERKDVAAMPGRNPVPDFYIDDLTPLMANEREG